jgi:TRAP-type C4-dicarboxylate transport system permease small subunit
MDSIDNSANTSAQRGPLFYIGAAGLLTLMVVETLSVIGRHVGLPLLGALEVIQAAILAAACAAMVIATITQAHASVHLLVERLPQPVRTALSRFASTLSALFFFGLAAGSLWLTVEFWNAHEQSELLGISFRPLRMVTTISTAAVALLFAYRAVRSTRR